MTAPTAQPALRGLEAKIPPPVVALLFGAAMWWVAAAGPSIPLPDALRIGATAVLAVLGVAFNVAAMVSFRRARTTLNPMRPQTASALVTTGVYRITRNPMYVSGLVLLCAWAVWLAAAWPLLGPPLFVLYITRFQIRPEERALTSMFGAAYPEYRARVRRWL